ncbi:MULTISPECIES: hypothetical protein [unclassified Chitinophaga]|uniref:hypothetical protein n=1 Tax=unclassified Chitinophaga TaxID=2619133 RepID=UPI0009CEE2BB|nr:MULTISPECIES: hypothetical protein [unclassified Chitinophaga]OMP76582.1 hypothetical protein BW716_24425 [[Flexibacter] sp. ATCC 35208]WPV66930.1 hypothetical protein QQL36_34625 [Chitinophaga sp. LS1]
MANLLSKLIGGSFFKSKKNFTIFDFQKEEEQLLLRSQDGNKNVDIIFQGVQQIQLPVSFSGLSIRIADANKVKLPYTQNEHSYNNTLFEIISSGEKFYLLAKFCKIYENDLPFNESSLNGARGKEIAGSDN